MEGRCELLSKLSQTADNMCPPSWELSKGLTAPRHK